MEACMFFKLLKNVVLAALVVLIGGTAFAQGGDLVTIPPQVVSILLGGGLIAGLTSITVSGLKARPWYTLRDEMNVLATIVLAVLWAAFFRGMNWMDAAWPDVMVAGAASGVFAAFGRDWLVELLKPKSTTVVAVSDGEPDLEGLADLVEAVDDAS